METSIKLILFVAVASILSLKGVQGDIHLNPIVDALRSEILENEKLHNFLWDNIEFGQPEEDHNLFESSFLENIDSNNDNIEEYLGPFGGGNDTFPVIKSQSLGKIRGKTMKSYFQRDFFAFQGIPYADPPPERFMYSSLRTDSLTASTSDVFDATYLKAKCPQASMVVNGISGKEDCLHLSVYTPDTILNDAVEYPVMFFIHGGAFISGDMSLYVPTKLMDKNVVVVVIQYRLGSLGFLTSQTEEAPGNMGLMDMIVALQWVQNYIEDFGGSKGKVTVFGQSAGSASSSWMLFTPLTKKSKTTSQDQLLNGIIAQSGSAIDVWTLDPNPEESLKLHADASGCDSSDPADDIIKCMRGLPLEDVVNGFNKVYSDDRKNGGLGFKGNCPVIQKDFNISEETKVIVEHPLITAANGDFLPVNIMTGSVREEGTLVMGLAWDSFLEPRRLTYNSEFLSVEILPFFIHAFGIPDITGTVSNSVRLGFLRDAEMGNWDSMIGGLIDATGMMFLKTGTWTLATVMSKAIPRVEIYIYSFEFDSNDSLFDWYFIATPDIPMDGGITHADDLLYLFALPCYMNDDLRQINQIKKMTTMWANFAKYGDPTPNGLTDETEIWEGSSEKWMPFTAENKYFMLMEDNFTMATDFTLRWNHNSINKTITSANESSVASAQNYHQQLYLKPQMDFSIEDKRHIHELEEKNANLFTATIALGVLCCVAIICIGMLAFKMLKK